MKRRFLKSVLALSVLATAGSASQAEEFVLRHLQPDHYNQTFYWPTLTNHDVQSYSIQIQNLIPRETEWKEWTGPLGSNSNELKLTQRFNMAGLFRLCYTDSTQQKVCSDVWSKPGHVKTDSFEIEARRAAAPSLPKSMQESGAGASYEINMGEAHTGVVNGLLTSESGIGTFKRTFHSVAGKPYKIRLWYKSSDTLKGVNLVVKDSAGNVILNHSVPPAKSYTELILPFTPAVWALQFSLELTSRYDGTENWIRFDDFAFENQF